MVASTLALLLSFGIGGSFHPDGPERDRYPVLPFLSYKTPETCFDRLDRGEFTSIRSVFLSPKKSLPSCSRRRYCGCTYWNTCRNCVFEPREAEDNNLMSLGAAQTHELIVRTSSVNSDNPTPMASDPPQISGKTEAETPHVLSPAPPSPAVRYEEAGFLSLASNAEADRGYARTGKYSMVADIAGVSFRPLTTPETFTLDIRTPYISLDEEARYEAEGMQSKAYYRELRAKCDFEAILRSTWRGHPFITRLDPFPKDWIEKDGWPRMSYRLHKFYMSR